MRLLAVLALGLALVSAGCFGGDDNGTGDNTNPTPVTSTPATPTGTGAGNGTGTGSGGNGTGGGTTPVPKAPAQVHTSTADFTKAPTPPATENVQTETFTVPAGYAKLTLTVNWTTTGPVVLQNGVTVNILGPDGAPVATCQGPPNGPAQTAPAGCTGEGAALAAGGDYIAEYKGSGNLQAAISVVAS